LLSRPDNWTIRADDIARESIEGRNAILNALKELRQFGYITYEKQRLDNGRFVSEQVVYDTPQAEIKEAPTYRKPTSGEPESADYKSLEVPERKNVKKKEHISSSSEDDGQFDRFWSVYPRKVGKGVARKAWTKALKETPADQIISGAEQYARQRAGEDPKYTAHPATWLAAERWTDEPDPRYVPKSKNADRLQGALERLAVRELRA
jgi:hypothetical protein